MNNLDEEQNKITQTYQKWADLLQPVSKYKTGVLGVLDIIGFSKCVLEEKRDLNTIVKIIADNAFTNDFIFNDISLDIRILSDTMIVFMEGITPESVIIVIKALENYRYGFLKAGFMTRGAIVSGPYFWEKDILVSPAFIEAYFIEEHKTIYPRIIIKDNLVDLLQNNHTNENDILMIGCYDYPKDLIYKDFDFYNVVRPFIILEDIAFYCYEKYLNKYRGFKEKNNNNNMIMFKKLLYDFKQQIEYCINNTNSDHEREKVNYLINEYNKVLNLCTFYPYQNELIKIPCIEYKDKMYK